MAASTLARQVDIVGPPGSLYFGAHVLALPNGNFAVSNPGSANSPPTPDAVYLFNAEGNVISQLTGSDPDDRIGAELKSLGNGNFVVISPGWHQSRGAVTFVNGTTGLSGTVSADNSLVGTQPGDNIGVSWVDTGFEPYPAANFFVVGEGNFVVVSNHWDDGSKADVGAVTWCSGTTGCTGEVTSANSLIGGTAYDYVGTNGLAVLSNGNYVVQTASWSKPGGAAYVGAITWGSGSSGVVGVVSPANSLVGSQAYDMVGATAVPLSNGNYVVGMPKWSNGSAMGAGAVVWGNGTTGVSGPVSAANAFVGSLPGDQVGISVTALSNGHYVVCNPYVDVGGIADIGSATWFDGNTVATGVASASQSLIGPASGKGPRYAIALTNGNYVVLSPDWDAGGAPKLGAVTWLNGSAPTSATVSATNSLVGSSANDHVGSTVVALSNGNYVVGSPNWDGVAQDVGAATWANGNTGLVGTVSAANSLVGSTASDGPYGMRITALANGNYVVGNAYWDNGSAADAGAATWGNGSTGVVGTVSAANSVVGVSPGDQVGGWVVALSNGNYVAGAYAADLDGYTNTGVVTWGNGSGGTTGPLSTSNSMHGGFNGALLGSYGLTAMADGNYIIYTRSPSSGFGAVTLGRGNAPALGTINAANSVLSTDSPWSGLTYDYDAIRHRLVVGRPGSNIVSLFTLDPDGIFSSGFEQ